jgi:calcineurin-like phosphoesterase
MSHLLKILYLGYLVGRPSRECIAKSLGWIKKVYDIDVVIANAENATSGAGLIREHAELLHSGIGTDLNGISRTWSMFAVQPICQKDVQEEISLLL